MDISNIPCQLFLFRLEAVLVLATYAVRNLDTLNGDRLREGQKRDHRTSRRTFRDVDLVCRDPIGALHLRCHLFYGDGIARAARSQILINSVRRAIVTVHQPRVANVDRPALRRPGGRRAITSCKCIKNTVIRAKHFQNSRNLKRTQPCCLPPRI